MCLPDPQEPRELGDIKVFELDYACSERRAMEILRQRLLERSTEEIVEAVVEVHGCIFHPAQPDKPNSNRRGPTPHRRFPIPR